MKLGAVIGHRGYREVSRSNSFRRSVTAATMLFLVSRSNIIYRFAPLSYFPSEDGEINVEE